MLKNYANKRILVFDTETTGLPLPNRFPLNLQPRIVEIGIVVYEGSTIIQELAQSLDPKVTITPEITKINGATNDNRIGLPTFVDFLPTLMEYFEGCDVLVAHNAQFDVNMLAMELDRISHETNENFPWPPNIICTIQEYYHVFGFRPSMIKLYEHIMGKPLEQTHRALDDAKALTEILITDHFSERL